MTTSASTLRKSARRLLRVMLLPGFALALLVALWIAVAYQVSVERQANHNEAVAQSHSLARVLSEHVSHILRQSDHATQLFKLKYEETDGLFSLAEFARRGGLFDSVLPARLNLPMALVNRNGKQIDSLNGFVFDDVSGQAFFKSLQQASADSALFSNPVVDATTGKWQIQVARRLNGPAGQFVGAIILMIDPVLFVDDYDRLNINDNGAMILMSLDSRLSIGRLGEKLFVSDRLGFERQRASGASSGELKPRAAPDTTERIYSYSDMPRYRLAAVVGIESSVAMARFARHRTQYYAMALLATLLIMGIVTVLTRQSLRLRDSMLAAREAQATLRAAADGSLDSFMILKVWPRRNGPVLDFMIDDVNDRGAAMFDLTRAELIGKKAFALLPRFRDAGVFERYVAVFKSGQPLEEEVELRFPGEPPYWLHHQIVPLRDGVAVTSRNITVRKHAEIEIHTNRGFLQSLIDHLPLLISVKSMRAQSLGTMLVWNGAAEAVTGYPAEHVIGRAASTAFPPGFALHSDTEDHAMLANPGVADVLEKPLLRPDGTQRYLHAVSVPLLDALGKTEYILCIAEDITQRREQELNLRTSEAQLAAVTNASPLGLVRADIHGMCTYVNKRFETITGLTREQSLGMGWLNAFEADQSGHMGEVFEHQRKNEAPFMKIARCVRPDGALVWASIKIAAVRLDGRIEGFVGSIDDITTLREAELALRESEARLRTIADTLPAMVAYIDASQVYRFHNRAYGREFGRDSAEVVGTTARDMVGEERYRRLEPYILRTLAGETLTFEELDDSAGTERTLEVNYIPQRGEDGSVVGFHVMRQDITSQKREKKHLLKLAQVDALTGLANRAGFLEKLSAAMAEALDQDRLMALMYMDIDHFKPVNDTYGHNVGDQLLKAFSDRLLHTLRASDTIARLGGDEFTIIMEKLAKPEDASAIAAKIVAAMQAPFALDGVTVSVSASIGLAYFRDGALDPDALLHQADTLLYQAKQSGRNTWRAAA